jgi:hypothetical protein
MRTTTFIILSTLLLGIASVATAATVIPVPTDVVVKSGGTFTVRYFIDPQGDKNYTTKLVLNFSTTTLAVESFTFASGWIPLSQRGYDSLDQTNGILIKTAGYPGGVAAQTLFGTATFRAVGTVQSSITVDQNSFALSARNANILVKNLLSTSVKVVSIRVPPVQQAPPIPPNLFDVSIQAAPNTKPFPTALAVVIILLLLILAIVWGERKRLRKVVVSLFYDLGP